MIAENPKSRDLESLREARRARRRRIDRNTKTAAWVSVVLTCATYATQVPEWWRGRQAEQRFLVARDAVAALRDEDRTAFEALLVDDAPADAYEASRAIVFIADLSFLQPGFVEDAAVGVLTAENYEIVVPLTADRRVVPELSVQNKRPSSGDVGSIRRTVSPNPIRQIADDALRAVFAGDRQAFEALLTDNSLPDSWEASVDAITGMTPRDERSASVLRSGMRSRFQGEDLDRCSMSFIDDDAVVRVSMRRVGRTWFVEGPVERTRG